MPLPDALTQWNGGREGGGVREREGEGGGCEAGRQGGRGTGREAGGIESARELLPCLTALAKASGLVQKPLG